VANLALPNDTEFAMQNNPLEKIRRDNSAETRPQPASLTLPGSNAYGDLPQFTKHNVLPFRRTIRRQELRQIVPLAVNLFFATTVS
jgi:prophage regulatory protein